MIGVVVFENIVNVDVLRQQLLTCFAIHKAAGGVGWPVRTVRTDGEYYGVIHSGDAFRRCQGEFLVAASLAFPLEMDHCFAAQDYGAWADETVLAVNLAGNRGGEASRLARLAVHAGT